MLKEAIDPDALRNGIELWVTVFPSMKIPGLDYDWLIDLVRSQMGVKAQWLRVQDCSDDETLYSSLLASAAIPFAFPQREINGKYYGYSLAFLFVQIPKRLAVIMPNKNPGSGTEVGELAKPKKMTPGFVPTNSQLPSVRLK